MLLPEKGLIRYLFPHRKSTVFFPFSVAPSSLPVRRAESKTRGDSSRNPLSPPFPFFALLTIDHHFKHLTAQLSSVAEYSHRWLLTELDLHLSSTLHKHFDL